MTLRRWVLLPLLAVAAGCATLPEADDQRVSRELLRLADAALATADSGEDIREVLRSEVDGAPGRPVWVAGHRFVLAPATLDLLRPPSRYRGLVSQSLELVEQVCLRYAPDRPHAVLSPPAQAGGSVTLAGTARGRQWVNVGLQLQRGCIVAMHFEQASARTR